MYYIKKALNFVFRLIFNILIPFGYIFFIFAGIIAALVSGVIEYRVFSDLFPKHSNLLMFSIPLLVVIVFETMKVFLIFLDKMYVVSSNSAYINIKIKSWFSKGRGILITISVVSTLLFSFYNLHNPEYENLLKKNIQYIESNFNSELQMLQNDYDNLERKIIEPIDEDIKKYEKRMAEQEKIRFRYNPEEFRGKGYNEAKKLKKESENKRIEELRNHQQARTLAIEELRQKKYDSIEKEKKSLKQSPDSSNKLISATLQVINSKASYPIWQYITMVVLLSCLLSLALEFSIWATFTILAINHGDFFRTLLNSKEAEHQHQIACESMETISENEMKSNNRRTDMVFRKAIEKAKNIRDNSKNKVSEL